jgi:hypothetical protein
MPKKHFEDEDEDQNIQQWTPIILKKEPILTKDNIEITTDQFIFMLKEKREALKLSQLQLNTKCKFPYKYTIRDIESDRIPATALEFKTICTILQLDLHK